MFRSYFKALEEESVRDNFVTIYELFDEVMDNGLPQATETKVLKEFILQKGHKLVGEDGGTTTAEAQAPTAITGMVSWRSEGIVHKKNEVYLDVVESLNCLIGANGTVLRSEVLGTIKMRCYLSGMPELRLGLNDKVVFQATGRRSSRAVDIEDAKFHQCVRLNRYDKDRTISFIPPDGEFDLMTYRLATPIKPLIWVESVVELHSRSRVEYLIRARTQFRPRRVANNVSIVIPVPSDADTPKFKASTGQVRYFPERSCIVWTIAKFPGATEHLCRAHFGLPSIVNEDVKEEKPPIAVRFEIPYYTTSGLQVRYLKVVERRLGYVSMPWVRYLTKASAPGAGKKGAGGYLIRMPENSAISGPKQR